MDVQYGYYVRQTDPPQQVPEVMQRFDLFKLVSPFQRCLRCNGLLEPVAKESIIDQLPETVRCLRQPSLREPQSGTKMVSHNQEFRRCEDCPQIYWKGSHYERLQQYIDKVLD
ncbi:MAG: Mut7-C RNAse domain-containing protein [Cyanomargarita calcarea GSE-NOS-MK-12-04C]|uniref:Mut7-C RNAse domain-containing protein n=1 Tax=Cyanomargarita calcarea GSE-NOS-MK-12-04C TaxID=2839659 RepID=A0A951QPB3_9CYAN|nr:Mut7-C RNAse domain-containing protein [Cyanomargarita calcarea GSE-NOS-MK-12-04C]